MRISQFQKYSQKENTVTNNILLMFSLLNDIKTEYYKDLIQAITEGVDYSPSPIFKQQVGIKGGVIDGYIEVKASKIVVETKLHATESIDKLTKYAKIFSADRQNYLWHISTKKYELQEEEKIKNELKKSYEGKTIHFNNLSFLDILENLEQIYESNKHDEGLKLLFNDFNDYCHEVGLIPDSKYKYRLIFVPTGFSFEWNFEHKIYFCPVNWHRQRFTYFGLYRNKSVKTIATIENCITADFDNEQKLLTIHSSTEDVTEKQKERLRNALIKWGDSHTGLKYYLFDENDFFETDFSKHSKGGIQGFRYKDLGDFLGDDQIENMTTKEISSLLRDKNWS